VQSSGAMQGGLSFARFLSLVVPLVTLANRFGPFKPQKDPNNPRIQRGFWKATTIQDTNLISHDSSSSIASHCR
jgi:hypothetical protein